MCNYEGYEFGARTYKDSICIDGWLYDTDSWNGEGYEYPQPDERIPCPNCNSLLGP